MEDPTYLRFGAALAVGALIGLERQLASQRDALRDQARGGTSEPEPASTTPPADPPANLTPELAREAELRRTAGLRTLTLVSLAGAVAGHVTTAELPWIYPAALLVFGALLHHSYRVSVEKSGDAGLTSEVVALSTFLLGGLCARGETSIAAACAVVVTLILSLKDLLHGFTRRMQQADIQALIKFAVLSMVILPLLPEEKLALGDLLPKEGEAGRPLHGLWIHTGAQGPQSHPLPGAGAVRHVFAVEAHGDRLRGELVGAASRAEGERESESFSSYVFDLEREETALVGVAAFTRAEEPERIWTARWRVSVRGDQLEVEREWLQPVAQEPWIATALGQGGERFSLQRLPPAGETAAPPAPREATPSPGGGWWREISISPRKVWYMVVLISAVSFAGYVLNKTVGAERGLYLTGALGGLVSSTAVSLAFSQRSRESPEMAPQLAGGILLANAIMPLRTLLLVGVIAPPIVPLLAFPLGGLVLVVVVTLLIMRLRKKGERRAADGVSFRNPFEITPALKFGAIFGVILILAQLLQALFGTAGLYALAVLTGLTDVDAIALAVANLVAAGTRDPLTGATMIALAALANTLMKGGIVATMGHGPLRPIAIGAFGAMLLAGTGGLLLGRAVMG